MKYATRYMLDSAMRPTVHDDPNCSALKENSVVVDLEEPPEPHSTCSTCHENSTFPLRSLLEG